MWIRAYECSFAMISIVLACVALLCYGFWFVRRLQRRSEMDKLAPVILQEHWLLGSIMHLLKQPKVPKTNRPDIMPLFTHMAEEAIRRGAPMHRLEIFPFVPYLQREAVVIHDYKLVKELLSNAHFGHFRKGGAYSTARPLIGDGLLSQRDGPVWRHQRKLANGVETARSMFLRWNGNEVVSGKEVDLFQEMLGLTLDVLGRVAFSHDFGSVTHASAEDSPLYSAFKVIITTLAGRNTVKIFSRDKVDKFLIKYGLGAYSATATQFTASMATLDGAVASLITARRADGSEGMADCGVPRDLLDLFLDTNGEHVLTTQQIIDNIKTFLFAGHDTTASAITWAVYLMTQHPKVESRLLAELEAAGAGEEGEGGEELDAAEIYQRLMNLPYLSAVIKEVLRLYPSAAFTRSPTQTTTLGDCTFPKGVTINVFPSIMQRDPTQWPRALEFLPERWLQDELEEAPRPGGGPWPKPYLPFSLGPRNCVGMMLAKAEIAMTLCQLIRNYKFSFAGDEEPRIAVSLSLTPNHMPMRIERRPKM